MKRIQHAQKISDWIAKISPAWRWSIAIWLAARIVLILLPLMIWGIQLSSGFEVPLRFYSDIPPIEGGLAEPLLGYWQRWDGLNYQFILLNGYAQPWASAFFPLYPLLGRAIYLLSGIHSLAALLLISNLAALFALKLLYEIIEEDYGASTARGGIAAALLLPTSFFLFAPYPTALSLLFLLFAYRSARRNQFFFATLAGLATGLTHGTSIPMVLLLGFEAVRFLRRPGNRLLDGCVLLMPLSPLMGTTLFLAWRQSQGFPGYAYLLDSVWGRAFQWPWLSLMNLPNTFIDPYTRWSGWSDVLLLALSVVALVWGWKRLKWSQWVYCLATIFFILSTPLRSSPLVGYGRYVLMMFPLFAVLGMWVQNIKVRKLAFAPALLAQFVLVTFYFFWMWVD
jgi:hypothetical protein